MIDKKDIPLVKFQMVLHICNSLERIIMIIQNTKEGESLITNKEKILTVKYKDAAKFKVLQSNHSPFYQDVG
jgi:hypothetical protein